jgi:tetratricopeptide (TPR) repeat protein
MASHELTASPAGPDTPAELLRRAAQASGPAAALLCEEAAGKLLAEQDVAAAVRALDQGIAALSPDPQAGTPPEDRPLRARLELRLAGIYEEHLGRLDAALLHSQRAFKLTPDDPEPLRRGRAIYQALGDTAMVSRLFDLELRSAASRPPEEILQLALASAQHRLYQQDDPTSAARVLAETLAALGPAIDEEQLPAEVLSTLAEAYVSPDYTPAEDENPAGALLHASDLYLALGLRAAGDEAIAYLRRALGANPNNAAAAAALERIYDALPEPRREEELLRLYRTGARVPRRGLKLLSLLREGQARAGNALRPEDLREAIAACRAGLEEAESLDEWQETRATLRQLLQDAGDLAGLGQLYRDDAAEAALPDERAELLVRAAEHFKRAGDTASFLASLEQAVREHPQHPDAFRKLCEYHNARRDLQSVAAVHELRLHALIQGEDLEPEDHVRKLEELADLYERKLQDVAAAADAWRRIDELWPTARSQAERKRLGQRLSRIQLQISELQLELDRTPPEAAGVRADLLRRLAQQYREQHEPQRAAALYEELLLFTPTDVPALKALYELREVSGDVAGQLQVLRQQVGVAADRAERLGLLRRMVTLAAPTVVPGAPQGQGAAHADTLAWACRQLLSELPSDRDALRRLGDALVYQGDKKGLLDTVEAHLRVAPTPREKLPLHQQAARLYEEAGDLGQAAAHLERAVRLCPPGPEQEAVLLELARIYGLGGRLKDQLTALELCTQKNARASIDAFRALARATQVEPRDTTLEERSLRAWGEVLRRQPQDLEALTATARLHRARGEWAELVRVLRRVLQVPDQGPTDRLAVALQLAEVLGGRMDDKAGAIAVLEQVQGETPNADRQLHRRLRALHEELGQYQQAVRYAERELLLTEDPIARMEVAMWIAGLWRHRASIRDPGRALLSYERVLDLLPEDQDTPEWAEGQRIVAQALEAMSELYSEKGDFGQVVALGEQRLLLHQDEPMRGALILGELAAVYEQKLDDPRRGFQMRRRAHELAPELMPMPALEQAAAAAGLWAELCEVHMAHIARCRAEGQAPPLQAVLAAARLRAERLADPDGAFRLLREALPTGAEAAESVATPGKTGHALLQEMMRLCRLVLAASPGAPPPMARDLLSVLHGLVDELCGKRGAAAEETAVRLHRLLALCAELRETVLGDPRGALEERLRAFSLGGERDRSAAPDRAEVFGETVAEIRRLALVTGQVKEALGVDNRRLERAETDQIRQQVAADMAIWLDEAVGDTTKALRAGLKALQLADEGSDLQAEVRGRLRQMAQRLGPLAWEEITRTERGLPSPDGATARRRLRYAASLWEGAGEVVRAIEVTGQAYKATFFTQEGRNIVMADPDADPALVPDRALLRAELDRLAARAQSDGEGFGRIVSLLDGIASQLIEAGEAPEGWAVQMDAARTDERRGRFPHAERRYQEVLRGDPGNEEALRGLERLLRQLRRFSDLAALLERRRGGLLERLPPGPERRAMLLDLGDVYLQLNKAFEALDVYAAMAAEDEADPEPHLRTARVHEGQRAFAKAAEAYGAAAARAAASEKADQAARALLRAAEIWERHVGSAERALASYQGALSQRGEVPPADLQAAMAGVERMLEKLGRGAEFDEVLAARLHETTEPAGRVELLRRRVALLHGILAGARKGAAGPAQDEEIAARALACAAELAALQPEDDGAQREHGELLLLCGQVAAARDVARRRAERASEGREGIDTAARASLWAQAAALELQAENPAGAREALERALALRPDDLESLRALAELRRHDGDMAGYAATLESLGAREADPGRAAEALLRAARAYLDELHDAARARQVLAGLLARYDRPGQGAEQDSALDDENGAARAALALAGDLALAAGDEEEAERHARREVGLAALPPERAALLHTRLARLCRARGEVSAAERHLRAALQARPGLLEPTRELIDLLTQEQPDADADAEPDAQIEALLVAALAVLPDEVPAAERAALLRQLGHARLRQGPDRDKDEAAYRDLEAAEALAPGGVADQVAFGETAFRLGHFDVAARYLGQLLGTLRDRPQAIEEAGLSAAVLAEALTHGAQAEAGRGATADETAARAMLEEALRLIPEHDEAEEHLIRLLQDEAGGDDLCRAQEMLVARAARLSAAGDRSGAVQRYQEAARVALLRQGDPARAEALLAAAAEVLAGSQERGLLGQLLQARMELCRDSGDLDGARALGLQLVELAEGARERAARLRALAGLDAAAEDRGAAEAHLRAALLTTPGDLGILMALAALLPDAEAAALLKEALPEIPEGVEEPRALVSAWAHLGALQARLGEAAAAAAAYDRALAAAAAVPDRDRREEGALRRAALDALSEGGAGVEDFMRRHLGVLLADNPLDEWSLRRLQRLEAAVGRTGAAARILQVLRVVLPEEADLPEGQPPLPVRTGVTLEEADLAALSDPGARVMAEVMATTWEGIASSKAPPLDSFGVSAADRLPPSESSADEVARLFAMCCRVLGNRKAALYRSGRREGMWPALSALPPTALVFGPALSALPPQEALFVMGRAVTLLRPEYILAEAMPPREMAQLFGLVIKAFHPRHMRQAGEAVAAWRRELPYRAVKRLSDLLREQPDVKFSTAAWRRAVRRTANRVGLVLCGDLQVAVAVLRRGEWAAGDALPEDEVQEDIRDLIQFWLQPLAGDLSDRVHAPRG